MENKAKKKNKKKILAAAIVLALIIVIGGTFAWFTSSDEVTNRLSSTSDYNVAITENFVPVESMTPGTTVSKEVAAVNTGSVDAFVKMAVSGQLELTTYTTGDSSYSGSNTSSYVALSTDTNANEVTSLQAGAILAYTTSTESDDTDAVGTLYTDGTSFTPTGAGFYVFARSVTASTSGNTWEYVGYYYDGTNYYAITIDASSSTINSDGTISTSGTAPTLTIDKTTTTVINAGSTSGSNIVFAYDKDNSRITATYDPDSNVTGDEIIFYINLDTNYSTNWTVDSTNLTFYYNKILASGSTSGNLISSVELADSVSESSYVSLNFDLNITLDSIQVSSDESNLAETVNADTTWWYAYSDTSGDNVTSTTTSLTWQSSAYSN